MRKVVRVVLAVVVTVAAAGFPVRPAAAAGAVVTVTPNTGLTDGQTVTVSGSGFASAVPVTVQECNVVLPSRVPNCFTAVQLNTTSNGSFSTPYVVVNAQCETAICYIGATDEPDGFVFESIAFAVIVHGPKPDVVIKRRSDGHLFFDNVEGSPVYQHTIVPGEKWTFAVLVQNDGDAAGDIVVSAPSVSAPFSVQYFWGYSDVTSLVTRSSLPGMTVPNIAPGGEILLAVRFSAAPNVTVGATAAIELLAFSTSSPASDYVQVGVKAAAP